MLHQRLHSKNALVGLASSTHVTEVLDPTAIPLYSPSDIKAASSDDVAGPPFAAASSFVNWSEY